MKPVKDLPDTLLVQDFLSKNARKNPDKVALVCGEKRFTYREADELSSGLAYGLRSKGIHSGSRVIIYLDNSAESVISLYGVLKAGCIFVMISGGIKAAKLSYIINDAEPGAIISNISKREEIRDSFTLLGDLCLPVLWVGTSDVSDLPGDKPEKWQDMVHGWFSPDGRGRASKEMDLPRVTDQDLAALIYTSGSTGDPKGIMSSHQNIISASKSIIAYLENTIDDIVIVVLPLSFDYGLFQVIMAFMFGGTVIIEKSFLYPLKILETIEREKVTGFPLVPTIAAMIFGMDGFRKYDMSSLRYLTNTGAALPVPHIRKLRKHLPHVKIFSMFGLTECKRVSFLPPSEIDRIPESVGIPMPDCEVYIVDEEERETDIGKPGELVVRGPNVTRGYWKDPSLTGKYFRKWRFQDEKVLFTGDYFIMDEKGYLFFKGRRDEMIKTKGERVFPKEIEKVMEKMEEIKESAVIGVPDESLGQAICAFIAVDCDVSITEIEVNRFLNDNLEKWMVPQYLFLVDNIPKTKNGKKDINYLKEEFNNIRGNRCQKSLQERKQS